MPVSLDCSCLIASFVYSLTFIETTEIRCSTCKAIFEFIVLYFAHHFKEKLEKLIKTILFHDNYNFCN